MPATMDAAYIEALGPVEQIRFGPLPIPQPGPTDLLVAVEAVSVDPVDTFVRSGAFPTATPFPFVIGRDLVGTVAATGPGATVFTVGDRVWSNSLGHGGRQGSFATYAVVPQARAYPVPDGVDPTTTVAVAHPAATAWLGLFHRARIRPGDTVCIGGGGGNVGDAAVRFAADAGARVLATASPADQGRVHAAGADVVVNHHEPGHLERLHAAAPEGIDLLWDTSGHQNLVEAVHVVAPGGTILLTAATGPFGRIAPTALYTRDVTIVGFVISHATVPELADAAHAIGRRLATGGLPARLAAELPLSAAAQAHRRIETGAVRGRLILRPDHPATPPW